MTLLTPEQLAALLSVSARQVQRLAFRAYLSARRIGTTTRRSTGQRRDAERENAAGTTDRSTSFRVRRVHLHGRHRRVKLQVMPSEPKRKGG